MFLGALQKLGAGGQYMNEDLFAALRNGVNAGSVPLPISGESVSDFRFRAAHAGALIGIQWLQDAQIAHAEAVAAELAALTEGQPSDVPVTSSRVTGGSGG